MHNADCGVPRTSTNYACPNGGCSGEDIGMGGYQTNGCEM